MVTASIASFILGLVMVLVILVSRHFNINPDNVATPIAASLGDFDNLLISFDVDDPHLGDLTTLGLLSWMASLLWQDLDKVSLSYFPLEGKYLVYNLDKDFDTDRTFIRSAKSH